jgi:hypothetical protein
LVVLSIPPELSAAAAELGHAFDQHGIVGCDSILRPRSEARRQKPGDRQSEGRRP